MKLRDKISLGLILFTIGIFVGQLFMQQVTVFSKLSADIEEFVDISEDGDENNTDEGTEKKMNESDDQIPFELGESLCFADEDVENKKVEDKSNKVLTSTLIIYDTPPELKV